MAPWDASDAYRHTRKAKSSVAKRQWGHVANSMLKTGHSEGVAIAAANSVVKKRGASKKSRKRSSK